MNASKSSDARAPAPPFAAANVWVDFSAITIAQRDRNSAETVGPSYRTTR